MVAERQVRPRILAIGAHRAVGGAFGDRHGDRFVLPAHADAEHGADREHRQRLGVVGIEGDRPLEQCPGQAILSSRVMRQKCDSARMTRSQASRFSGALRWARKHSLA